MSESSCENIFQDHYEFWSHLSDKQKTYLISHTHEVHYKRGENLHYGGDDCIGVILIASGMFRIYLLSDEGRDVTLFRLYDHDVCMLSASCALDAVTFDVHIDAESETVGYLIEAAAFRQLMNENIYVKSFADEIIVENFSDVMWTMQQILFMGIDKRLALFLYDEMSRTGQVEIRMTHDQIARYIGSAREVVSRMLKYFVSEKMVELSRGGIRIVDKEKLRRLAG